MLINSDEFRSAYLILTYDLNAQTLMGLKKKIARSAMPSLIVITGY